MAGTAERAKFDRNRLHDRALAFRPIPMNMLRSVMLPASTGAQPRRSW